MSEENTTQLGEAYHNVLQIGRLLVEDLNEIRVHLGMALIALKSLHEESVISENYGNFSECLTTMKLSSRRVNDMIWNAQYIKEQGIPEDQWRYLDLGVVRYFRRKKLKLPDIDDIKELSWNDLIKV